MAYIPTRSSLQLSCRLFGIAKPVVSMKHFCFSLNSRSVSLVHQFYRSMLLVFLRSLKLGLFLNPITNFSRPIRSDLVAQYHSCFNQRYTLGQQPLCLWCTLVRSVMLFVLLSGKSHDSNQFQYIPLNLLRDFHFNSALHLGSLGGSQSLSGGSPFRSFALSIRLPSWPPIVPSRRLSITIWGSHTHDTGLYCPS